MSKKMKNKKTLMVLGLLGAFVVSLFAYWIYEDNLNASGRLYPNQSKMCEMFAKSYLRTMRERKGIDDLGGDAWTMAIDIETEITKLCQLELTPEAIGDYKPAALEKYQTEE